MPNPRLRGLEETACTAARRFVCGASSACTLNYRGKGWLRVFMTNVAVYSVQPILVAGLQAVLAPLNSLMVSGSCPTIAALMEHLQMERPDLLLIELTEDVTLEVLGALRSTAANAPVILWADAVPTEFASQAIRLGVRGFLRMSLPVELQVKCLQKVAAGEFWSG